MALHFSNNFKVDIAKLFQLFIVNNLFSPTKTKILIKKQKNVVESFFSQFSSVYIHWHTEHEQTFNANI